MPEGVKPNGKTSIDRLLSAMGFVTGSGRAPDVLAANGFDSFEDLQSWYDDGRVSENVWRAYQTQLEADRNLKGYTDSITKWLINQNKSIDCILLLVEQVEQLQKEVDLLLAGA